MSFADHWVLGGLLVLLGAADLPGYQHEFAPYYTDSMIFDSLSCQPKRLHTMGTARKTVTLTDQQDNWVKAQINAGHYTNDSEYIRDLIRREQERSAEIDALRASLIEGETSGEPRRFDPAAFKQRMLNAHG